MFAPRKLHIRLNVQIFLKSMSYTLLAQVIGLLAGLAGAAFVAINMQLRHFRQRYMLWGTHGQYWRILEVHSHASHTTIHGIDA